MTEMRVIAKMLARRDREAKTALVKRRRAAGLKQSDIDAAFGFPDGWTRKIEAYWSDPSMSDMRRYEAIIAVAEGAPTVGDFDNVAPIAARLAPSSVQKRYPNPHRRDDGIGLLGGAPR